jgi:light-regulated signal transduction histidine kinase (bacteriophytochrome)
VMRVSDNGLGIDLEKHANSIFSLYKRFHLHTEGRGLGLYLIKTQMTAVGGHVEVESTLGEGTTFILYFRKKPIS